MLTATTPVCAEPGHSSAELEEEIAVGGGATFWSVEVEFFLRAATVLCHAGSRNRSTRKMPKAISESHRAIRIDWLVANS